MLTVHLSLWLLLVTPGQATDPEQIKVEEPEQLMLLTDGKRHYLAISRDWGDFYYGDGSTFYQVPLLGGGGDTTPGREKRSYLFGDPRMRYEEGATGVRSHASKLRLENNVFTVLCARRETVLTLVPGEEARSLLESATFKRSPHRWRIYSLSRDDEGTYFFVDKGRWSDNEKEFRVFIGPKGNMKLQKLRNVVSDSEGDIFATPKGDLRLILSKQESYWVSQGKKTRLVVVPIEKNAQLIYNELGVYPGIRLGTPCDDL